MTTPPPGQSDLARAGQRAELTAIRAAEHLAATGHVVGEAAAPDSSITVVVSPGGMLRDVRLTQAALRRGAAELSRDVTALAAEATRRADAKLRRALSTVLDAPAHRALADLGIGDPPGHRESPRDWDDWGGSVLRRPN